MTEAQATELITAVNAVSEKLDKQLEFATKANAVLLAVFAVLLAICFFVTVSAVRRA